MESIIEKVYERWARRPHYSQRPTVFNNHCCSNY
jgi:hypothetical protein